VSVVKGICKSTDSTRQEGDGYQNLIDADEMRGEESNHRDFGLPLYLCCRDRKLLLATRQWLKIIFLLLECGRILNREVADREPSLIGPVPSRHCLEAAYGANQHQ
jgi:hypothetical protein